ncbi:FHA domain-containing protein [Rhodocytophaga rosea]|uniref:FHA domain-containing protein n=1 Tax=Rhodocytophaga rosea TaxID=2704465 RepID=A0A6C0GG87_9BACT|nr:FHA domain-containing protein [Rhodocytophaga rosea]QHT67008.1 FHA domain-containing protein [Rhodocytophaga rosea]
MRIKFICLLISSLFFALQVQSQNFIIQSTDVSAYPLIRSRIQLSPATEAKAGEFKVLEDRKELEFTLKEATDSANTAKEKTLFILIEASGFTYGKALENFKKAVNESLSGVNAGDKVNVAYFGKASKTGRALNILSAEFTSDVATLKREITSQVSASRDTTYVADVYKAIYEALDFIVAKQNLPENKRLIVLSAAINNSRSPIKAEDCIEKSLRSRIPIYTITYKTGNRYAPDNFVRLSDRTNGETTLAKTQSEISAASKKFISRTTASKKNTGAYILEFTTANKANGRLYQYEVRYQNQRQPATYTTPVQESSGYGLYIFIIVALVGGGMAWFLYQTKQKKLAFESGKQAEQDALLRQASATGNRIQPEVNRQPERSQPVQVPAKDLKRTILAGGSTSPVLMVSAGTFSQTFTLSQPQITIGRSNGNDIVIPEATVSGKHAVISNENGNFYLTDLGSTNSTLVNNARIQGKHLLKSGDIIRMGAAQLKFQI